MRNRDKTPDGLARLADKSRDAAKKATGEDRKAHERVAAELDAMAREGQEPAHPVPRVPMNECTNCGAPGGIAYRSDKTGLRYCTLDCLLVGEEDDE